MATRKLLTSMSALVVLLLFTSTVWLVRGPVLAAIVGGVATLMLLPLVIFAIRVGREATAPFLAGLFVVALLGGVCLFGPAILDASIPSTDWVTFTSAEGGFSVMMPQAPVQEDKKANTVAGVLIRHTYKCIRPEVPDGFHVGYSDMPVPVPPENADKVLDNIENGFHNAKARLKSLEKIKLDGHFGRELIVLRPGIATPIMKSRVYLIKNGLYEVVVATTEAEADSPKVSKFLNSFKLIAK